MYEQYPNPYKAGREFAQMSREAAAMALNVSCETLKSYEIGRLTPPPEIVVAMADLYMAPWLMFKHECRHNPIFRRMVADNFRFFGSRAEATINLCRETEELCKKRQTMLDMVCGRAEAASDHLRDITKMIGACIGWLCFQPKEKAAHAGATVSKA